MVYYSYNRLRFVWSLTPYPPRPTLTIPVGIPGNPDSVTFWTFGAGPAGGASPAARAPHDPR